ncbi:MAG TPA: HU family DNA-binding protein [Sandaracinaceae bacterium LLY-WYZ-13_1]|nr:HU family DNA-binding protein [Sandaracinaceae bacterium LLY-WYZ-13_1]
MTGPTDALVEELIANGSVEVPGLGELGLVDGGSRGTIVKFWAASELEEALNGGEAPPSRAPWSDVSRSLRAGERHEVPGLGVFAVRERRGYVTRSPATGEPVEVPARRTAWLRVCSALKARVRDV